MDPVKERVQKKLLDIMKFSEELEKQIGNNSDFPIDYGIKSRRSKYMTNDTIVVTFLSTGEEKTISIKHSFRDGKNLDGREKVVNAGGPIQEQEENVVESVRRKPFGLESSSKSLDYEPSDKGSDNVFFKSSRSPKYPNNSMSQVEENSCNIYDAPNTHDSKHGEAFKKHGGKCVSCKIPEGADVVNTTSYYLPSAVVEKNEHDDMYACPVRVEYKRSKEFGGENAKCKTISAPVSPQQRIDVKKRQQSKEHFGKVIETVVDNDNSIKKITVEEYSPSETEIVKVPSASLRVSKEGVTKDFLNAIKKGELAVSTKTSTLSTATISSADTKKSTGSSSSLDIEKSSTITTRKSSNSSVSDDHSSAPATKVYSSSSEDDDEGKSEFLSTKATTSEEDLL